MKVYKHIIRCFIEVLKLKLKLKLTLRLQTNGYNEHITNGYNEHITNGYNERPNLFATTGVCYNWVDMCTKWSFGTEISFHYNRVFVLTEFVTSEFH